MLEVSRLIKMNRQPTGNYSQKMNELLARRAEVKAVILDMQVRLSQIEGEIHKEAKN